MNKFTIYFVASVLAVATVCSTVCLPMDDNHDLATTDLAEESEGELEAIDFRLSIDRAIKNGRMITANILVVVSYVEELRFLNFAEVPNPPPKF